MRIRLVKWFPGVALFILLLTGTALFAAKPDFYAYHTKVSHSATDYMGKYADLIVVLGEGKQLEFTRQTGYLPRWRTLTSVSTIDDIFPDRDPDHRFYYTYVRLLEESPEKIVVHWRYFKDIKTLDEANRADDPLVMHGFTGVVHEVFTIRPDGSVEREVKNAEGTRLEDWNNPEIKTTQTIRLTENGITHGPVHWGKRAPFYPRTAVKGNPVKTTAGLPVPDSRWTFDEGLEPHRDAVAEKISGTKCPVEGLMTLFKKGVSGTALAFDGYYTGVRMRRNKAPAKDAMTIEAWVALDAYPYNMAPIVHHSENFGAKGYYLGLDPYGHPFFRVNGSEAKSPDALPLHKWVCVAGSWGAGRIRLFVDGKKVQESSFQGSPDIPETDLFIGRNTEKERCTDYVRGKRQNIPFLYGIQGLLDEITMYDKALTDDQIAASYTALLPADQQSDLAAGILPGEVGEAKSFGAFYKKLDFSEIWDGLWRDEARPDVVVKFDDNPTSVIFWRGTNHSANRITDNNRWMSDQSSEIGSEHGCSEHMADKQDRHSFSRIIENSPARVVVAWRYPCVDVGYDCTDQRNWSDEYHTIYPDGTHIRKVIWDKTYDQPGFEDIQFLTNPGETALDVVHLQAMTVANTKGETRELVWEKPDKVPENTLPDACIEWLNSKSRYKVFAMFQGGKINPWGKDEQSKYSDDPFAGPWNHWPVNFVPSDGRFVVAPDRVSHFALGASDEATEFGAMVLYGVTDQPVSTLIPLAKSWRTPANVKNVQGGESAGYDKDQGAFVFRVKAGSLRFTIDASSESPVVNPCFVIKGWKDRESCRLVLNGKTVKTGPDFRKGIVHDIDSRETLVVWMRLNSERSVDIRLHSEKGAE